MGIITTLQTVLFRSIVDALPAPVPTRYLTNGMFTLTSLLFVFTLLTLSSLAVFWARKLRLPHSVLLVAIGAGLGLLSYVPSFSFITDFHLTPELLFYVFLPTLIFESAYNISLRKLIADGPVILTLAIASLIISTGLIGGLLFYLLPYFGIHIPLTIALLFGSLISATDPVAVLALFKEYGAPRRLSLVFEGESLFNDATAVALFLVLLEVVLKGYNGVATVQEGVLTFGIMLVGGTLFGLVVGMLFAKLVGMTRENEAASITLTIVLAHVTFLLSEFISHHVVIGGQHMYLSSIIATTSASLVMGNYGRAKIHPHAEEFVEKLWGQLAFMANSIIFILVGLLFVAIPLGERSVYLPIALGVLIVAFSRALSIYPTLAVFNIFATKRSHIPTSWQHLLSWGSLRGALAVTLVLLIPESLEVPGWSLGVSPRDFILSLTIGCIFATIFIKATTIKSFMKSLKLDAMTNIERLEYQGAQALIHNEVLEKLREYRDRGYVSETAFQSLIEIHNAEHTRALRSVEAIAKGTEGDLTKRVIRMYAIGIERAHLKELYAYGEISERVFKRIMTKLELQYEVIERGNTDPHILVHTRGDRDIVERIATSIRTIFFPLSPREEIAELYGYYRAQSIISRKVLKELGSYRPEHTESIFTTESMEHALSLYKRFREQTESKLAELERDHAAVIEPLRRTLASCGVAKVEEQVLAELQEKELITPKLHVTLKDELGVS